MPRRIAIAYFRQRGIHLIGIETGEVGLKSPHFKQISPHIHGTYPPRRRSPMADITGATHVHRNTISNWRTHNPAFARELLNATRERALKFRDRAEALVPKAIRVLDAILDNDKASPSVRPGRPQNSATRSHSRTRRSNRRIEAATIALPKTLKSCTILHNRPSASPSNPAAPPSAPAVRPQIQTLLRHEALQRNRGLSPTRNECSIALSRHQCRSLRFQELLLLSSVCAIIYTKGAPGSNL